MAEINWDAFVACPDGRTLENVILDQETALAELGDKGYDDLREYRARLRQVVSVKSNQLLELDFSKTNNRAFVAQMFYACSTLGLTGPANVLYNIIREHEIIIGQRLEAAMMILKSHESNDDYIDLFDGICEKLESAYLNEDDSIEPVVGVFVRYYAQCVRDMKEDYVRIMRIKIQNAQNESRYSFLNSPVITSALEVNPMVNDAYEQLQGLMDAAPINFEVEQDQVSEEQIEDQPASRYSNELLQTEPSMSAVRSLCNRLVQDTIENEEEVFRSLGRGVRILTSEEQLLVYMHSYAAMHEAKLMSAFEQLPIADFPTEIDVIDWGCGQGMATMCLVEYLRENYPEVRIDRCTLIEPSKAALGRACLHVAHFDERIQIRQINKGFDSIVASELECRPEKTTIHLFSNVLDYEGYDIVHLYQIVSDSMEGCNYFVCVSPYINDVKADRISGFERRFVSTPGYMHIYDVENMQTTWRSNWTRIIRLFAVE